MRSTLLVEDDEAFRYAASRHLTAAGFRVVAVATTMGALAEVDANLQVDAFLVDVAMPAGNPHGLSFGMMMHHRFPAAGLLFITGFPDRLDGYIPGKVLFKPVELDELTGEIQALFLGSPAK
jgi:CheY-like chemotaxis protein